MKKLLGNGCLSTLIFALIGSFAALFIGSIAFNQSQATLGNVELTTNARSTVQPPLIPTHQAHESMGDPAPLSEIQIEIMQDPSSPSMTPDRVPLMASATPFLTATPGLPAMGTLSYPLTVTAEVWQEATKAAHYRRGVQATRTANALEAMNAHMTLTAAASEGK